MGLRGPGAKPVKARPKGGKPAKKAAQPWTKRGLSRSGRVVAFIESLPITSGVLAGERMRLREWQRAIIRAIYDPVRDDGLRVVRTALLTMPRKNGKTGLAAALALCHLCGPEAEARGQVYSAAADKNQAALLYAEMKAIIEAVPWMAERTVIRDFNKHLEDAETGSIYQALSAEVRSKHGFSASFIVYDELAQAPDRHLYDVLTTSTAARAEPLTVVISTMSPDPLHIMSELVAYGRQVLDGVIADPTFHASIFSAPMEADPWSEETWRACNPALGDFRSLDEMRTSAMQARRIPARETAFRNLYLNQPVNDEKALIKRADWLGCQVEAIDAAALRGRPCWGGLDLSSTTDLTALVLYFPDDSGAVLPWFWLPGDNLQDRADRDKVPYVEWRDAGFLETPAGRAVNKLAVAQRLAEIAAEFDLQGLAFDRWRMKDLQQILDGEGIDLPLVEWGQGYVSMGPALDAFETAILNGNLKHAGHPVLTWNIANAVVTSDPAGNRKLDKDKARTRIDGAVALAMACGLHAKTPPVPVFEFAGDRVLVA